MRVLTAVLVLGLISGCSEPDEEPVPDMDRINQEALGGPEAIELEGIRYPDIEKNNLYGAGCAFTPDGGGLAPVVLAMRDGGYLKINGEIERFAPDAGSAEQPYNARSKYDSLERSFELSVNENDAAQSGYETVNYPAKLIVKDSMGRVVFNAAGIAQCGA